MRCSTALCLILAGLHAPIGGAEEPATAATATPAPAIAAPVKSYLFSFWVGKRLEAVVQGEDATEARRIDARVREVGERPCGKEALARVGRIPAQGDGYLEPDLVQELDEAGRITRTWVIPIEYWPVAIDGDRVLVQGTESPTADRYWIDLDRRIELDATRSVMEAPVACVIGKASDLPPSDFQQCRILRDRKAGTAHRLAYQGVCT